MSYPKIAVGGGKYCYSGPNCRTHGAKNVQNAVEPYTVVDKNVMKNEIIEVICDNSVDYPTLYDLKEKTYLDNINVHYCETHKTYHVYINSAVKAKVVEIKKRYINAVLEQASVLTREEYVSKMSHATKEHNDATREVILKGADVLKKHREEISFTVLNRLATKERVFQKKNKKYKIVLTAPKQSFLPEKLVTSKHVEEETLIEYWACGRKKQMSSQSQADDVLKKVPDNEEMSSYKCSYCNFYHIGHHDKASFDRDNQISSARKEWDGKLLKANIFLAVKNSN